MAFNRLRKPARRGGSPVPMITIGTSDANRQTYLALNSAARKALGDPAALVLEFDPDELLLRVVVSSPEDPDSYAITKANGRVSVTRIMRDLDLTPVEAQTLPATKSGRTGLIVDVSQMRTGSTARDGRRAA